MGWDQSGRWAPERAELAYAMTVVMDEYGLSASALRQWCETQGQTVLQVVSFAVCRQCRGAGRVPEPVEGSDLIPSRPCPVCLGAARPGRLPPAQP